MKAFFRSLLIVLMAIGILYLVAHAYAACVMYL